MFMGRVPERRRSSGRFYAAGGSVAIPIHGVVERIGKT
jgi:hypothetical protein